MRAFDRFSRNTDKELFYETKKRRAFVFFVCGSWFWVVCDQQGKIIVGERDWNMDVFQACERAISEIESATA